MVEDSSYQVRSGQQNAHSGAAVTDEKSTFSNRLLGACEYLGQLAARPLGAESRHKPAVGRSPS